MFNGLITSRFLGDEDDPPFPDPRVVIITRDETNDDFGDPMALSLVQLLGKIYTF